MLSPVPTYRFLGIILDSGLTGRPHLESTTIKAKKILQVLSAIRNTWWSAHPQLLLTVYRSMLRASIEYGSLVFGLSRSRTFRKLEVLQNHAVRTCLGCQISTPVNTLFAEAKKLPLHLRFQFLAEKFFIKILSVTITSQQKLYSDWQMPPPPLTITVSFPICQLTSLPLFFSGKWLIVALINPTLFLLTGTLFLPDPNAAREFDEQLSLITKGSTVFYTDGFKMDNNHYVGSAVYLPQLQALKKKAWAIYNAILSAIGLSLKSAFIVTNSLSVLNALCSFNNNNNYIIPRIKAQFHNSQSTLNRGSTYSLVPYFDYFSSLKEKFDDKIERVLTESSNTKGTRYFQHIYQKTKKPWYYRLPLRRKSIVTVMSLRVNHYNLKYSLFRKNFIENSSCVCRHPVQDVSYLMSPMPGLRWPHQIDMYALLCRILLILI
ncbi:hypothetical protein ALC60_01395 [Trachymyrmex zeteki]|uniref:RNase H type-1 domain-containing protein n=1 Tax=Mycetomoellerius zeteki TaxID=64791 RepID=A0A151XGQ4_9HYME|nr:hypothetical protein ALC60_01395 [Trachymyrmex zeteki]